MGKDFNRHLTEENTWMENMHMKECSTSYIIRKMQTKTMIPQQPINMARIKTMTEPNAAENVEQQNSPSLLVGMQNGAFALEDNVAVSYRTKSTITPSFTQRG